MLFRHLIRVAALAGSLDAPSALADKPMPPPAVWTTCSPSGDYCARLDPEETIVTVYRADAPDDILWSMPGWFRVAALADDGDHLVTGYDGRGLVPRVYDPDMTMLAFHRRGAVVATVPLDRLIGRAALQHSRAGFNYYWGDYVGFDEDGYYVVRTAPGREYRFDVTTGRMVR